MTSTTVSIVVPIVTSLLSTFAAPLVPILANRWLSRSEKRDVVLYRRHAVEGWDWWVVGFAVAATLGAAFAMGTLLAWGVGVGMLVLIVGALYWLGHRKLPLAYPKVMEWLEKRHREQGDWGGLSYRLASIGLTDRTYTEQGLIQARDVDSEAEPGTETLSPQQLIARGSNVLMTGEAGVGKSTNLRQFGSDAASQFWRTSNRRSSAASAPAPGWLPVLVAARQLAGKSSVEEALGQPPGMLAEAPAPGARWLVLVDAVDEVLNPQERHQVLRLLAQAVQADGPFRFVITSRSVESEALADLKHEGVLHFELHPFTDDQLRVFVTLHQSHRVEPAAAELKRVKQFMTDVTDKSLVDVVRLPLLAKLAADMYFDNRRGRDLSLRRVDLYEYSIVEWLDKFDVVLETQVLKDATDNERYDVRELLDRLEKQYGGAGTEISRVAALRLFLTDVANAHLSAGRTGRGGDLVDQTVDLLRSSLHGTTPRRLPVKHVLLATGLIRDPNHDPRFWHQTFAEYLAAPMNPAEIDPTDVRRWVELLDDARTRPMAVFAFHQLPVKIQANALELLLETTETARAAVLLATEGVLDTGTLRRLVGRLWDSRNRERFYLDLDGFEAMHLWWLIDQMAAFTEMRRRLKSLPLTARTSHDHFCATVILAKHGDKDREARLKRWATTDELSYDEFGYEALMAAIAHIGGEYAGTILPRLVTDTKFDIKHREVMAEALIRSGWVEGWDILSAFVTDVAQSHQIARERAAWRLSRLSPQRGIAAAQKLRTLDPVGGVFLLERLAGHIVGEVRDLASQALLNDHPS